MRYLTKCLFLLAFVCGSCSANLETGLSYKSQEFEGKTTVHVLTLDPAKFKIIAARAQDAGLGIATVKELAQYFSAIAAINGGFFRVKDQNPEIAVAAGALKTDNQWHGIAYKARGAIGWDPGSKQVVMDILQTESKRVGVEKKLEVKALPQINKTTAKLWEQVPYIVSAGPLLILNSKQIIDFSSEELRKDFIENKHARTAVGILPDKQWVFVVAERDLLEENSGLTIAELSNFMQALGCTAALNLDGGSSSVMYLEHELENNAIFGRPVANALLVLAPVN